MKKNLMDASVDGEKQELLGVLSLGEKVVKREREDGTAWARGASFSPRV
jgi:hypothetical protein